MINELKKYNTPKKFILLPLTGYINYNREKMPLNSSQVHLHMGYLVDVKP
jgi:hypothetical protein